MGQNMVIDESWQVLRKIFETHGIRRTYEKDNFIFMKAEQARYIGFITSGQARTVVTNSDGDALTLFYLGENNMIGSESLLKRDVCPVIISVQAITECTVYLLPKEKFWDIFESEDLSKDLIIQHLVMRITTLSDYIACSHFRDNRKRIAYFLHSNYMLNGPVISHTNEQIAAITGVNRVSVNRIINALARDEILRPEYKKIVILDDERLQSIFGSLSLFGEVDVKQQ